ncbi:hypothetical protein [Chlorogloeopsis fritschii]
MLPAACLKRTDAIIGVMAKVVCRHPTGTETENSRWEIDERLLVGV